MTLFEKLDGSNKNLSLQQSVINQVQRILSTRSYLGQTPKLVSYVTGFGLPEVVNQSVGNSTGQDIYRKLIRRQILLLEPRVKEVEVKTIHYLGTCGRCQLVLQLAQGRVEEQFFF